MNIKMAGIDYQNASVEDREKFSMTSDSIKAVLTRLKDIYPSSGFVILHTCNRTEIWISENDENILPADELLCDINGLPYEKYQNQITLLNNMDAVRYLFELASGLHSQILGDDQIITQVKRALVISREQETAGSVLEVLFRIAVTAAKRVKTELTFTHIDTSVSSAVITLLKEKNIKLGGASCLVIGNGEVARTTAEELIKENADVVMTLRRHNADKIRTFLPPEAQAVPYENRYLHVRSSDIIISATKSSHQTLTLTEFEQAFDNSPKTLIDLAIPRDIDPKIAELESISYYNMDSFLPGHSDYRKEMIESAQAYLDEPVKEFEQWYLFRKWIPAVKSISRSLAEENIYRLAALLPDIISDKNKHDDILKIAGTSTEKTISKLLYSLRSEFNSEELDTIFPILERISKKHKN